MSCQKTSTHVASQERPNHANLLGGTLHPASPNHGESQSSALLLNPNVLFPSVAFRTKTLPLN